MAPVTREAKMGEVKGSVALSPGREGSPELGPPYIICLEWVALSDNFVLGMAKAVREPAYDIQACYSGLCWEVATQAAAVH